MTSFELLQQLGFMALFVLFITLLDKRIGFIKRNILLGRKTNRSDNSEKRFDMMFRLAFGQKKMFDRPLVGLLHFAVYAGFLLINIEILEIIIDGLTGNHRIFADFLGGFYIPLISFFEIMALAVVLACSIFLIRRNIIKVKRFHNPEMKGWPFKDANIILFFEIALMMALYIMNATDAVLQQNPWQSHFIDSHYNNVGYFAISGLLIPIFDNLDIYTLLFLERNAWWIHIFGIFSFAIYVTYSKHLHIFLAFPNTYYSNLKPKGEMENMDAVTNEVKIMLGIAQDTGTEEIGRFGAKDVQDLSWKNLMDAYTCTECGRCTSMCPASITGKKLSPRKIVMDTRDRLEEVGRNIDNHGKDYEDGKSLYGDYITKEELMACTTCNACTEVCPINIDPLSIITQVRRYIAMEESDTPASWNTMFSNTENNFAPWAFPSTDRFNWAKEST